MDPASGLQSRVAITHRVFTALHNTGRLARDDADRFIEIMHVSRQAASGVEQGLSTTHFDAGDQRRIELIDEFGIRPGREPFSRREPVDPLRTRNTLRIVGHRTS